jgi:hypothetical protein
VSSGEVARIVTELRPIIDVFAARSTRQLLAWSAELDRPR